MNIQAKESEPRVRTALRPTLEEYKVHAKPRRKSAPKHSESEGRPNRCSGPYWIGYLGYVTLEPAMVCCKRGRALMEEKHKKEKDEEDRVREEKRLRKTIKKVESEHKDQSEREKRVNNIMEKLALGEKMKIVQRLETVMGTSCDKKMPESFGDKVQIENI